ncbi:hypothetical protein GOODEAATRI_030107, partial [Goodea atripinnis]
YDFFPFRLLQRLHPETENGPDPFQNRRKLRTGLRTERYRQTRGTSSSEASCGSLRSNISKEIIYDFKNDPLFNSE